MKDKLDHRYKATQLYLSTGKGEPVYRKRAFPFIDRILGGQHKWITKTPEQYFSDDEYEEAQEACRILSFTGEESFDHVRQTYIRLSRGSRENLTSGWHPDHGGHSRAFDILNRAYTIFKEANRDETN